MADTYVSSSAFPDLELLAGLEDAVDDVEAQSLVGEGDTLQLASCR